MSRNNKPTIYDLTHQWPTSEEMSAIRNAISEHSGIPIVVALLGTAMVEYELEKLLRSRFRRQDDTTWGRLVGDNGPLNTFAAKITAGHAFGLYDEDFRRALNVIKTIRNVFAHSKKLVDFSHELIGKELNSLPIVKKKTQFWREVSFIRKEKPSNKTAYILLCYAADIALMNRGTTMIEAQTRSRKSRMRKRGHMSPYAGALTNYLSQVSTAGKGIAPQLVGALPATDPKTQDNF